MYGRCGHQLSKLIARTAMYRRSDFHEAMAAKEVCDHGKAFYVRVRSAYSYFPPGFSTHETAGQF